MSELPSKKVATQSVQAASRLGAWPDAGGWRPRLGGGGDWRRAGWLLVASAESYVKFT